MLSTIRRLVRSVIDAPFEAAIWLLILCLLKCVLDARVQMPTANRPVALGLAVLLMTYGGYMFTSSSLELPNAGLVLPGVDPSAGTKLQTTGEYSRCRHPQYAGLIALCLGVCILSRSVDRLFWTLLLMVVLDKKADLEERELALTQPGYARYIMQVPKFTPNFVACQPSPPASPREQESSEPMLRGDVSSMPPSSRPLRLSDLPDADGRDAGACLHLRSSSMSPSK